MARTLLGDEHKEGHRMPLGGAKLRIEAKRASARLRYYREKGRHLAQEQKELREVEHGRDTLEDFMESQHARIRGRLGDMMLRIAQMTDQQDPQRATADCDMTVRGSGRHAWGHR